MAEVQPQILPIPARTLAAQKNRSPGQRGMLRRHCRGKESLLCSTFCSRQPSLRSLAFFQPRSSVLAKIGDAHVSNPAGTCIFDVCSVAETSCIHSAAVVEDGGLSAPPASQDSAAVSARRTPAMLRSSWSSAVIPRGAQRARPRARENDLDKAAVGARSIAHGHGWNAGQRQCLRVRLR